MYSILINAKKYLKQEITKVYFGENSWDSCPVSLE